MKEIMAFIRVNKVKDTRDALALNGFGAYTCRKCLGRGKNRPSSAGESIFMASETENSTRLMAKRLFMTVVEDNEVNHAVKVIIEANRTGNPGDGKIFVRDIEESVCVRTGETVY